MKPFELEGLKDVYTDTYSHTHTQRDTYTYTHINWVTERERN